jgi:hypothetical protein
VAEPTAAARPAACAAVAAIKLTRATIPARATAFAAPVADSPTRPDSNADALANPVLATASDTRADDPDFAARAVARNALRASIEGAPTNSR